ncbi:MAG: hypothetical protein ACLP56_21315, partial [Candidatus Sulfotelmatobacter sp.]
PASVVAVAFHNSDGKQARVDFNCSWPPGQIEWPNREAALMQLKKVGHAANRPAPYLSSPNQFED